MVDDGWFFVVVVVVCGCRLYRSNRLCFVGTSSRRARRGKMRDTRAWLRYGNTVKIHPFTIDWNRPDTNPSIYIATQLLSWLLPLLMMWVWVWWVSTDSLKVQQRCVC